VSPRQRLRLMIQFYGLAWQASRALTASVAGLVFIGLFTPALIALGSRYAVDGVVLDDRSLAVTGALVTALSFGVASTAGRVGNTMRIELTLRSVRLLEDEVLTQAISLDEIEHLEKPQYVDRLSLLRRNSHGLVGSMWAPVDAASVAIKLLITIGILASIEPYLILLVLFAAPAMWMTNRSRDIQARASIESAADDRREQHLNSLCMKPGPAKEIRLCGIDDEIDRRATEYWRSVTSIRQRAYIRAGLLDFAGWSIFVVAHVCTLGIVSQLSLNGDTTPGTIVLVIMLVSHIRSHVGRAVGTASRMSGGMALIEEYGWLNDYYRDASRETGGDAVPARCRTITFEGVTFTYGESGKPALSDVNLRFHSGETVGIVGRNGAGKTTLLKLLSGFYRPAEGRILIDEIDMRAIDQRGWRSSTVVASQDFAKFYFVARESVGIGNLAAIENESAVWKSIERAGADQWVRELPEALESQLGKEFDGVELSQGQWQKISIARSMMRNRPLVTIFDEPTGALDVRSEDEILSMYARTIGDAVHVNGGFGFVVSHRLSMMPLMDKLIVLDEGRVIEAGTHDELMSNGGSYSKMFSRQASAYS
jgi:ATP-binding cassette, subfamily B, bacterial